MVERETKLECSADSYPGVNFAVYDASDFHPRGLLRSRSEIKAPYGLSKVPDEYVSMEGVVDAVMRDNPSSDIERTIKLFTECAPSEISIDQHVKIEPEKIFPGINMNLLRDIFKEKPGIINNGDRFKEGDKLAIVWSQDSSFYLFIDVERGDYRLVLHNDFEEDTIKRNSNEKPVKGQHGKSQLDLGKSIDESNKPFENEDLVDTELRKAKDKGKRKDYPKETQEFFDKMLQADLNVESLLVNNMALIVPVSESIQRLARRKGREYIKKELSNFRNGKTNDLAEKIEEEMLYAQRLHNENKTVTKPNVITNLSLLLKAERFYLDAILAFPWNKIGPEPFDILLDVFWFRFGYKYLANEWQGRSAIIENCRREAYKEAQIHRILEWVREKKGHDCSHLKELKDLEIKYEPKIVAKDMGPLHKFFDAEEFREQIIKAQKKFRPSGLTLLLWKTLKWASPSENMVGHVIDTSDLRFVDAQTWEEHFPDPLWVKQGDFQGRLVLSGEDLTQPLSHLQAEGSTGDEIRKRIYLAADEYGIVMSNDNQKILEKATNQRLKQNDNISNFETVAKDFQIAVARLSLSEIEEKISKMNLIYKIIVLHRLGYNSNIVFRKLNGQNRKIDKDYTVQRVIYELFAGKANQYYRTLKQITASLVETHLSEK